MALYIDLREYPEEGGMNWYFFLTNQYSKEELAEKLQPLIGEYGCDQNRLKEILKKGKVLKEDYTIRLKGEAVLNTQCQGTTWYYNFKDKITIHPNGTWTEERYWPWWKAAIMFLYEKKEEFFLALKNSWQNKK